MQDAIMGQRLTKLERRAYWLGLACVVQLGFARTFRMGRRLSFRASKPVSNPIVPSYSALLVTPENANGS
jgi:hypothetical protein